MSINKHMQIVENMVEQYKVLKVDFKWEQDMSRQFVALQHAIYSKNVTPERITQLKEQVKNETKAFSPYRNQSMFTICGLLSAHAFNASQQLSEIISYEDVLKRYGFKQSTYLPFTAYVLSQINEEQSKEVLLSKASDIYQSMKKNHPLLTSGDDYTLALLLAASDQDIELVESYYQSLVVEKFQKSNGLQLLSHILALNSADKEITIAKVRTIMDELKSHKLKPSTMAYPVIGLLALLEDSSQVIEDFIELVLHLKKTKHFKWQDRNFLMLVASGIIASDLLGTEMMESALQAILQNIMIAQQVAIMSATNAAVVSS